MLDRPLLFVTGKGGVGKTAVASALAVLAADRGARVLLCELDAKGDLAHVLETDPLRFEAREVLPSLWAMTMDTEASLREYLKLHLRIPLVGRIGALARTFDFVATAAPGVKEILTIGKLAYEVREKHYDMVIVDSTATGHVVGQLASPAAIREVVRVGLVRHQVEWILEILEDPATTAAVVVTTPEEMPVLETLELAQRLDQETNVALAGVIVNQVLPELFGTREEALFTRLQAPASTLRLTELAGPGAAAVLDGAALAVTRRRNRALHLERLQRDLPADVPLLFLPFVFSHQHGRRATRQLADALAGELE
jgi:anion-transporting  ArsA/GET3 family ATPase